MFEYQVKFKVAGKWIYDDLLTAVEIPGMPSSEYAIVPMTYWRTDAGGPHSLEFDLGHQKIRVYNHPFALRTYSEPL